MPLRHTLPHLRNVDNLKFRFGTHSHISLRATLFTISLIVFGLTTQTAMDATLAAADMPSDVSPNKRIQFLSQKWRSERNFWIGALIVVLWYVLGGLLRLREENAELREQLEAVTEVVEREYREKSEKDKKDKKED